MIDSNVSSVAKLGGQHGSSVTLSSTDAYLIWEISGKL